MEITNKAWQKIILNISAGVFLAGLLATGTTFAGAAYFERLANEKFNRGDYGPAKELYQKSTKFWPSQKVAAKIKDSDRFRSYSETLLAAQNGSWEFCLQSLSEIEADYPKYNEVLAKVKSCNEELEKVMATQKAAEEEALRLAAEKAAAEQAAVEKARQSAAAAGKNPPKTATKTYDTTPVDMLVDGNEECQQGVYKALNLLKSKDLEHFDFVLKYIKKITCTESGAGTGMYAFENPPRYQIGMTTVRQSVEWFAGTIVHDANHAKLYQDALTSLGYVPNEAWTGAQAELKCLEIQKTALTRIGGTKEDIAWLDEVYKTKYWEIPADQRNW